MHRLTILYIIFFLFVSTSIWLTNHIYIFCSQSLTNLISVLFSGLQSSEKVFHKKVMFYTNPFTSRPILHNQTPKIIIDFSPFKYSLKIFAAPLFTYNVLLIFNFKRFPPFLYSDLRKSRLCNFILLQTSQCDISSTGNNSDLNIIPKGIFSKYF